MTKLRRDINEKYQISLEVSFFHLDRTGQDRTGQDQTGQERIRQDGTGQDR